MPHSFLDEKARILRGQILDQITAFGNGHLASAYSCLEILLALYYGGMRIDPEQPDWSDRDRLILSKGHGCSALYAILSDLKYFPSEYLIANQNGNILGGHPDREKIPGVEWSCGALGHGLAIGIGMALAAKYNHSGQRIFVLLGDGELQEGSVWEAILFAGHHRLNNLVALVDYNRHQSSGAIKDILDLDPLDLKFASFCWEVRSESGHDITTLQNTLQNLEGKGPAVLLCATEKGYGVNLFMQDPVWHTQVPSREETFLAKQELGLL